jgi:hypothetical protein
VHCSLLGTLFLLALRKFLRYPSSPLITPVGTTAHFRPRFSCCVLIRRHKKSKAAKFHHSANDKQYGQHDRPASDQEMAPAYATGNTSRNTTQHVGQKQYDTPHPTQQYNPPTNDNHYDAPQTVPIREMQPAYGTGNTGRSTAQNMSQKPYDAPQYTPPANTSHYDAPQAVQQYPAENSTSQSNARIAEGQYDMQRAADQSQSIYSNKLSSAPPQGILKSGARY